MKPKKSYADTMMGRKGDPLFKCSDVLLKKWGKLTKKQLIEHVIHKSRVIEEIYLMSENSIKNSI